MHLTYHKNCHRKNTKTVVNEEKRIVCVCKCEFKKNKMRVVQKESLKIGYGTTCFNDNAQQRVRVKKIKYYARTKYDVFN